MTVKLLYRFPGSSETIESDSFEKPGKISTFFFTFFYFFTSAVKHSCHDTNFKARKVYSLFDALFSQLFTFSFFIASIYDFKILITWGPVVIIMTITMNIYSIITLRVRYNNIFRICRGF